MLPYFNCVSSFSCLERTIRSHTFWIKKALVSLCILCVNRFVPEEECFWSSKIRKYIDSGSNLGSSTPWGSFSVLRGTFGCHDQGCYWLKQISSVVAGWLTMCWTELTHIPCAFHFIWEKLVDSHLHIT